MVIEAARTTRNALAGAPRDAWSGEVPHLDWTVRETVAHAIKSAYFCGIDLAAGDLRMRAPSVVVDAEAPVDHLLDGLLGAARLTSHVVRAAAPHALGYDPDGPADASGFAAMCCAELLIHGWDAATGLAVPLTADARLASAVLARLFPELVPQGDPWSELLWACGRIALPGKGKRVNWTWWVRPLDEH
ncbi:mycothiol maleylpyruvate isomerase-like protein [Labedaea rhizosphaerae]|uniref:Mycothiol maleylpyruvate isomerase-like protein n=2 Tax=Labedaea rhizosphaerae TaxID=598644 RepID=A0A4R6S8I3_LABRH|nr:mycothiol maleylpyruvate isomerase-like protein [Labedaea rhizosphaerae]